MEWQAIIVAVLMSLPPIVAQITAAIRDERKNRVELELQKAQTGRMAINEWKELFENCQKRASDLEAAIQEKNRMILELQEKTRPRPAVRKKPGARKPKNLSS